MMQFVWFFAFGCFTAHAFRIAEKPTHLDGGSGWNVSLVNGSLESEDVQQARSLLGVLNIFDDDDEVSFLLYTKSNPDQPQKIRPNSESIKNSYFEPARRTVFFIHGWLQDSTTNMSTDMRHAYFENAFVNFIFVDWSKSANMGYVYATNKVPKVGESLANMVDRLVLDIGVDRLNIRLVGHSLGAHVAGFCGKNVKSGKVERIYALDSAAPMYHLEAAGKRFDSTDAKYTLQITTNAYQLGCAEQYAKVAIYANGGKRQPGCDITDYVTGLCSHRRSVALFIESIKSLLFALVKCENVEQALDQKCGTVLSDDTLQMSHDDNELESGVYHLHTNDKSPYGAGTP